PRFECGADDGPPDRARLQWPLGVAADPAGGPVYVADTYNSSIRVWEDGRLRTLPVAGLDQPGGLDVLPDGRLVVADTANHRVVVVDPRSGAVDEVVMDETWVHASDGPPVKIRAGAGVRVPVVVDLVDEELDPSPPAPLDVVVECRPRHLLEGGGRRQALAHGGRDIEVRAGRPGEGTLLVEVTARTRARGRSAVRVQRRRHDFDVTP
ncbi:MAG: hypothetical protein M3Q48_06175, partial [Actinomycetota bacterium]|nr:hypothetical protein [Actinomycetota bacterium]